jgi:hypothetical protein
MIEIDIDKLRADLVDYFGTAKFNVSPLALIDLSKVENASEEELVQIALKNGFDLTKYQVHTRRF